MLHNQTHLFQAGKNLPGIKKSNIFGGVLTDLQIQMDLKLGGKTTACWPVHTGNTVINDR